MPTEIQKEVFYFFVKRKFEKAHCCKVRASLEMYNPGSVTFKIFSFVEENLRKTYVSITLTFQNRDILCHLNCDNLITIKPIFHCDAKPFTLSTFASPNANIPTC